MKISTKGRYALRVMVDLAERYPSDYIPLKEIAQRQEISQKYLEGIMSILSKEGLIDAHHGKGGGYRLNRHPSEYSVGSILKLTEGSLAPVACLDRKPNACKRKEKCKTLPMWTKLEKMINDFFDGITILDLAQKEI